MDHAPKVLGARDSARSTRADVYTQPAVSPAAALKAREATEAYPAERATALAGVPRSTLHYWASHDVWKPSVSPERVRLWSLSDIVVLRIIHWLRRGDKAAKDTGLPIPRTTMREVRELMRDGVDLSESHLYVDHRGRIVRQLGPALEHVDRQQLARPNVIDVLAEYRLAEREGFVGPNLAQPRPLLRIVPGKLAGEPHVVDTRLSTAMIDALLVRGYTKDEVIDFYPFLSEAAVDDARSLEEQLRRNLRSQAA
ncbi:MAG: DUF433 domain-containing protein [Chloroflexi bacterium]|nr:MAG: DUF433 domain-containing protein [Chloroflexota bacterium]